MGNLPGSLSCFGAALTRTSLGAPITSLGAPHHLPLCPPSPPLHLVPGVLLTEPDLIRRAGPALNLRAQLRARAPALSPELFLILNMNRFS